LDNRNPPGAGSVLKNAPGSAAKSADKAAEEAKPADKGGIVKPSGPARLVYDAYQKCPTAKTEADYLEIIGMVDEALQQGVGDEHLDYAKKLKGWAHNKRGEALLEQKKTNLALGEFEMAVEMNPDHWKARQNRGVSFAEQGKTQEAIADFSRVIQLNPGYANAWFNRGELAYQQGDIRAALRDYTEAIRRLNTDPVFYQARGNAYHQMRRFNDALIDFNRAIELDADSAAARLYRGDTQTVLGNYEQAAEDYRQAIRLNDQLGRAYQSTAWLMATCPDDRFRDPARAVLAARKAIELDGDKRYQYLETLAAALAANGEYGEAIKAQQKAVELAPQAVSNAVRDRLALYEREQPYRMRAQAMRGQWQPVGRR
jgi:tetratricopeptide (TPR) repeat protein